MNRALKKALRDIDDKHGVVRLNYKDQLAKIIKETCEQNPASYIFSDAFESTLRGIIDKCFGWIFGLILLQLPIYFYLILTISRISVDFTMFGIKINNTVDVKIYFLLALSLIGLTSSLLSQTNQIRCAILDAIVKAKHKSEPIAILKYAMPDGFYTLFEYHAEIPGFAILNKVTPLKVSFALFALITIIFTVGLAVFVQISIWVDAVSDTGLHLNLKTGALFISAAASFFSLSLGTLQRIKPRYLPVPKQEPAPSAPPIQHARSVDDVDVT